LESGIAWRQPAGLRLGARTRPDIKDRGRRAGARGAWGCVPPC